MGGHQQKYLCFDGCPSRLKTQWDGISGMGFSCTLWLDREGGSCPGIVTDNIVVMVKDEGGWGGSGSVDKTYCSLHHYLNTAVAHQTSYLMTGV